MSKNDELIRKHIGKSYPLIVWPYGTYNGLSKKAASELGMPIQFSIEKGLNKTDDLSLVRRAMILSHFSVSSLAKGLSNSFLVTTPIRAVSIDLDSIWMGSEMQSNINLGKIIDKAAEVRPNLALIQTFSSTGESYFPTSQLNMKANFFPRVAHSLQNRSRVEKVFATIPLKYLKNSPDLEKLIHDLALYSDIDGVFFDSRDQLSKNLEQNLFPYLERAMKTGSELRPSWSYGFMGPAKLEKKSNFKYIIQAFETNSSKAKSAPTLIVSLESPKVSGVPKSFQKLKKQGFEHFFLPLDFNSYSDLDFLKKNFSSSSNPYSVSPENLGH